jgi:hypothetical protein
LAFILSVNHVRRIYISAFVGIGSTLSLLGKKTKIYEERESLQYMVKFADGGGWCGGI